MKTTPTATSLARQLVEMRLRAEAAEADARSLRAYLEAHPYPMRYDDLVQRAEQAERKLDAKQAQIDMVVDRVEGTVEGAPTSELNYLQRIDELREAERAADRRLALLKRLDPWRILPTGEWYCVICGKAFSHAQDCHYLGELVEEPSDRATVLGPDGRAQ